MRFPRRKARLRNARYYLSIVREANRLYLEGGDDLGRGLDLFDVNWLNIRNGFSIAADEIDTQDESAALCSEYCQQGTFILNFRQKPSERRDWILKAIRSARRFGKSKAEANHFYDLGSAQRRMGDLQGALESHREQLRIAQEIPDPRIESWALGAIGRCHMLINELDQAVRFVERSLELSRRISDRRSEGEAARFLGTIHQRLGDWEKAAEFLNLRRSISRQLGHPMGEANALAGLGNVELHKKRFPEAIDLFKRQLWLGSEYKAADIEVSALGSLGRTYLAMEDLITARGYLDRQIDVARRLGYPRGMASGMINLGRLYLKQGEPEFAITTLEEGERKAHGIQDERMLRRARRYLREARDRCRDRG